MAVILAALAAVAAVFAGTRWASRQDRVADAGLDISGAPLPEDSWLCLGCGRPLPTLPTQGGAR